MSYARKAKLFFGLVLAAAVATALACGDKEVVVEKEVIKEVPVQVVVEKEVVKIVEVPVEKIVEKTVVEVVEVEKEVVVEKIVEAMSFPVPGSELIVVIRTVGSPVYHYPLKAFPHNQYPIFTGMRETLLDVDKDGLSPMLASAWEVDEVGVTFTIAKGASWHLPQYGTATGEDIHWSFEQSDREDAVGGWAAQFYTPIVENQRVEGDKLIWDWKIGPHTAWSWMPRHHWGGLPVMSQGYYDDVGEEASSLVGIGTGPYMLVKHVADDLILLEGVKNHWRVDPGYESVRILEVEEEATRIAMFQGGDADLIGIGLPRIDQVEDIPGARVIYGDLGLKTGTPILFGGDWRITIDEDGNPPRTPRATELPWVGELDDPVSMANALKVRQAMAMAINRADINTAILGGRGCIAYQMGIDTCSPRWQDRWAYEDGNPEKAMQLLEEAGYPDGFDVPYWIAGGRSTTMEEVAQAIAGMWENIGLNIQIDTTDWASRRPEVAHNKQMTDIWSWIYGGDISAHDEWLDFIPVFSTRIQYNLGQDFPEIYDMLDALEGESDPEKAWAGPLTDYLDYMSQELTVMATVSWRDPWIVGPNVGAVGLVNHGGDMPELESLRPSAK